MARLFKTILFLLSFTILLVVAVAAGAAYLLWDNSRGLPDYTQLAKYDPPTVTRVHAGDGSLIAEYAVERRVFVPVGALPRHLVNAFIAAEDKNFYHHPGVDASALGRALVTNGFNIILRRSRRPVGASTITQQVAKNFLLTNELSFERKIKEAILAFRIERTFSKQRILELYLNEIYLGYASYGVAAAALNYFNKSLDELTIAEAAYLAALPKAPNNYHPIRKHDAAVARRNWVVGRMLEENYIDNETARQAMAEKLEVVPRAATLVVEAGYFLEEVRRELVDRFGEKRLYEGGLSVRTTLNPRLQRFAERALRDGLVAYDRRHGWRGPIASVVLDVNWVNLLKGVKKPTGLGDWNMAIVLDVGKKEAEIGLADGTTGRIPLSEVLWARAWMDEQKLGPEIRRVTDVLKPGDVVVVEPVTAYSPPPKRGKAAPKPTTYPAGTYGLRQIPDIGGSIVAVDPHTGRILAMSGGYDYDMSEFNRATQARRQPGSAFKPFVYLAALDNGFTPSTIILDAPIVIDQGPEQGKWKPGNYTKRFYGPSPMRIGVERSRNLMTVRLAKTIGMTPIVEVARRFGVNNDMPKHLSMALGAGETTLLRLTTAYAMLVNGGKSVTPALIDRVQDKNGKTIFRNDTRQCETCLAKIWDGQTPPEIADDRQQIAEPTSVYQVVSMLQGVVKRGTGRRVASLGKPLAGKTGTTNESRDAWFIGFSPDLAVGVFVGFDQPRTLGGRETGSNVAAPIFKSFMSSALEGQPTVPFRIPAGIRHVRVNAKTGRLARPRDRNVILEAFKVGTEPDSDADYRILTENGEDAPNSPEGGQPQSPEAPSTPARGLY